MFLPTDTPTHPRDSLGRRRVQRHAPRRLLALIVSLLFASALSPTTLEAGSTPCDCESCHGDHHQGNPPGCSSCHWAPPKPEETPTRTPTGSHALHYSGSLPPATTLTYGDTRVSSTETEYKFSCGNCHPLDRAKHRDGTVEVELADASAPAESLKAKNPAEAAYNPSTGTCSKVYCHSGYSVSSTTVGPPLTSPPNAVPPGYSLGGPYILDQTCNLTYEPYTVNYTRVYATTPAWGATGSFTACTECHAFPLTTSYPTVEAGVGDSHAWVDDWGYINLHAWNMSYPTFGAVPCRTCHYSTVTVAGATHLSNQNGQELVQYDPVPISNRAAHVNGRPDVAFDTVNGFTYRNTYGLSSATYDPTTKTCSEVACHYNPTPTGRGGRWQKIAKWGAPYRWWESAECDLCHNYGLGGTCQPTQ